MLHLHTTYFRLARWVNCLLSLFIETRSRETHMTRDIAFLYPAASTGERFVGRSKLHRR